MGRHDPNFHLSFNRCALQRGLYASTPLRTAFGWRPLSDLGPGDLVMTQEDGLRPIADLRTAPQPSLWSVRLPQGALGNAEAVMLPPGQPILIRTAYAMPFSGDNLALVPATALEGWRGIVPHVPAMPEAIVQIRLDRPATLAIGPGLLTGCEGMLAPAFDVQRLLDSPSRPILPLAAARQMVAHLVADEACGAISDYQATFRAPKRS